MQKGKKFLQLRLFKLRSDFRCEIPDNLKFLSLTTVVVVCESNRIIKYVSYT